MTAFLTLAAELVREHVAVIATIGGPVTAFAAKAATTRASLSCSPLFPTRSAVALSQVLTSPGGNLTGSAGLVAELDPKRLELLSELAPDSKTVAALLNPNRPGVDGQERDLRSAAKAAGRDIVCLPRRRFAGDRSGIRHDGRAKNHLADRRG